MSGIEAELTTTLMDRLRNRILEFSTPRADRIFIRIDREDLRETVKLLVDEGFTHLSAITALNVEGSIEILYHLSRNSIMITLRITLPQNDHTVPTITDIIPGAILHEREVHDLFGVEFNGHPDLRPLILPDDWSKDAHPMWKRR